MADTVPLCRYFGEKVKFLKNESRIIAVTPTSVIGYDFQTRPREVIPLSGLMTLSCPPRRPHDLVLTSRDLPDPVTYACGTGRDGLAAQVLKAWDDYRKVVGFEFKVEKISRDESNSGTLWITQSQVIRTDVGGNTTFSQKFITDIDFIVTSETEPNQFVIKFKHSSIHAHHYSSPFTQQIISHIAGTLHDIFCASLQVRECYRIEDIMPKHDDTQSLYETVAKKHYQKREPRECILALTRTQVIMKDKSNRVWSIREIPTITAVVLYQDKFYIQYHHVHYTRLSSPDKEIILANLLGISKESGHSLEVICREPASGLQILPFPRPEAQKAEEYFVQKLLNIAENNDATKYKENIEVIQEYNANVSPVGPVIKDKKVILSIFAWLQFAWSSLWEARHDARNALMEEVLDLLATLTRIFSSSRFALEEATNAKALKPLLLIVLKSGFFKLNYGVCALVQSMISHHDPKAAKQATINRNFVFTNDVLEEVMNLLSKSVTKFSNTLATYLFTNLLECCLYTQIQSTDWQLAKILATLLLRNLHVLFDLCRSPCRAVAKNITILIEFVLQESKSEPAGFKSLQDECRSQCALIWQIYLAVSTPSPSRHSRSHSFSHSSHSHSLSHSHSRSHDDLASLSISSFSSISPPSSLHSSGDSMKNLSQQHNSYNNFNNFNNNNNNNHVFHKPLHARVAAAMAEGNQESFNLFISNEEEEEEPRYKPIHVRVAGIMAERNSNSMELILTMFPPHLFDSVQLSPENMTGKLPPHKSDKHKIAVYPGDASWYQFFERVQQDFEEPNLVWNDATRKELCDTIVNSVEFYTEWKAANPNAKHVWNFEEFSIKYKCLEDQLKVGKYYVNTILNLGNKCHLKHPEIFVDMVIHKLLLINNSPLHQIAYLRAITWCYAKIENILSLLETQPQAVADHVLLFLEEIFATNKNVREFVKHGGTEKAIKLLSNTTTKETEKGSEDELGTYTRLNTVMNLLSRTLALISPLDSNGCEKVPLPHAKAIMGTKESLKILVNVVASLCDNPHEPTRDYVFDGIAGLLDKVISHNEEATSSIYETGLFYFLLYFDGPSFSSNAKLLYKIHSKQSLHYGQSSILQDYLPSTMIDLLEEDPLGFADVFTTSASSPVLVWNQDMRDHLRKNIFEVIGTFLGELAKSGTATFSFSQIHISYPNLENYFMVGKYYVDNLVEEKFTHWQIPNRETFFYQATANLQNLSTLAPVPRVHLLRLLRQQYTKISPNFPKLQFNSLNEWLCSFVDQHVVPDLHNNSNEAESQVETICEVVRLLEVTGKHDHNFNSFLHHNGFQVLLRFLKCLIISCKFDFSFKVHIMNNLLLVMEWINRHVSRNPMNKGEMYDVLKCTISPPLSSGLCFLALECIHTISSLPSALESLYLVGAHYFMLRIILHYMGQRKEINIHNNNTPVEESGMMTNMAASAARILFQLSELESVRASLSRLISAENVEYLFPQDKKNIDAIEFMSKLYSPSVAMAPSWDQHALDRLVSSVSSWINDFGHRDSHEEVSASIIADSRPLQVGDIFVDAFNADPKKYEEELPLDFIVKLLEMVTKQFSEHDPKTSVSPPSLSFSNTTRSLALAINNSLSFKCDVPDDAISSLLATLSHPYSSETYTDAIFEIATLDNVVAPLTQAIRSNVLTGVLQDIPLSRTIFLPIICKFVQEQKQGFPECILQSKLLPFLLLLFMNKEENKAYRFEIATLFHEMSKHDESKTFQKILHHVLPPYLVMAFSKFEPDESITLFDMNTISAEFIWNEKCRNEVRQFVFSCQENNSDLIETPFVSDLDKEPQVCNVYLQQYCKTPSPFTMTSPPQFLHELISSFSSLSSSSLSLSSSSSLSVSSSLSPLAPQLLAKSLFHLLYHYSKLSSELSSSDCQFLVEMLDSSTEQETLESIIGVINIISKQSPQSLLEHPIFTNISKVLMLSVTACVEIVESLLASDTFKNNPPQDVKLLIPVLEQLNNEPLAPSVASKVSQLMNDISSLAM